MRSETPSGIELIDAGLTESLIGGFYDVYHEFGYGFLEAPYKNSLAVEYRHRGHDVRREVAFEMHYRGVLIGRYRADMIIDGRVLIEVKAIATLTAADHRQISNYQRATRLPIALLFHFGPDPAFYRTVFTAQKRRRFEK